MVDQEGFQRHRCMLLGRLAKTLCMQPDLVRSASLYIVFLFYFLFGVEGIAVCWIVFVRESCVDFVRESCFPFVF